MGTDRKSKFTNIDDFLNKEIPENLAEKLKVAGRIEQILRPTRTSAVSGSSQEPGPRPGSATQEISDEIDSLINNVKEMEDLVEQLEDMADDQLKDMSIPPVNGRVAKAAKSLGSSDGTITKDVIDQANLIRDFEPILLTGIDPVTASLTGQGIIDPDSGSFLNCNEFTRSFARKFRFKESEDMGDAEMPLADMSQNIAAAHESSLGRMMLDIIQKMIWNILWVKLIVDHVIINPSRLLIANPLDNIVLFFKRDCGRFRRPSSECRKQKGPLNKLLNKLRTTLICKVPPIFYDRYDPMEHGVRCPQTEPNCPDQSQGRELDIKKDKSLKQMTDVMDELGFSDCVNSSMFSSGEKIKIVGPGLPPECYENKNIVLQAVLDNSLNPPKNAKKNSVGTASNSSTITGAAEII